MSPRIEMVNSGQVIAATSRVEKDEAGALTRMLAHSLASSPRLWTVERTFMPSWPISILAKPVTFPRSLPHNAGSNRTAGFPIATNVRVFGDLWFDRVSRLMSSRAAAPTILDAPAPPIHLTCDMNPPDVAACRAIGMPYRPAFVASCALRRAYCGPAVFESRADVSRRGRQVNLNADRVEIVDTGVGLTNR